MCGIAGILRSDPSDRVDEDRLRRMRDVLTHRGPDGEGLLVDGPIGLGHRRLAIVDLEGGHQPMSTHPTLCGRAGEDGAESAVWIVYNGEIYNHPRLKPELEARGHVYRTRSDTETILHLYEEHGDRCTDLLDGMFAFALWDRSRGRLLLARDRLGIKPLYYRWSPDELVFASEIKAILLAGGIRPRLNEAVLPEYLATRYVSGEETLFDGIRCLPPGHVLTSSAGQPPRLAKYWSLPARMAPAGTGRRRVREVREHLDAAAASHLMSDVPIGLFLSGGIDSTALAALVSARMKEPLQTFSVGFDDPMANELAYARLAARSVRSQHHEVIVNPEQFFAALPRLIWHEDEPIAFSSSIPLYFVSRLARERVKVVLTGEGADELFLGYNRYRVTLWNERLGRFYWSTLPEAWSGTLKRCARRMPPKARRYIERSFLTLPPEPRGLFYDNFSVIDLALQSRLLAKPDLLEACDPYGASLRHYRESPGGSLDRMGRADMLTYLVRLLMKQDRMSMAASIESRVPFLDNRLVEHVAAVPGSSRMGWWRTKGLMRDALAGLVPPVILRRRKMGFPVPLANWFRDGFRGALDEFVTGPRALERGLFRADGLRRLVLEHAAGRADHSERLWLLLNLEIWHRIFIDGETSRAVAETGS